MVKFSVIVVCLNAGNDLIKTVNNILEQTYDFYEIIIKDGFSKDNSLEKLPYSDKIRLIQKEDKGIYDAMNQGIDSASGDYLVFINAGDGLYDTNTLKRISQFVERQPSQFLYGHCYNESMKVFSNSPKKLTKFFCYRTMICHQAMVFEKNYILGKKYDCSYNVSADREILLSIVVKDKVKTQYIPLVVASYKGDGYCETEKSKVLIEKENEKLRKEYFKPIQIYLYRFLLMLTFPKVRRIILVKTNMTKTYKYLVGLIYGNKHDYGEE